VQYEFPQRSAITAEFWLQGILTVRFDGLIQMANVVAKKIIGVQMPPMSYKYIDTACNLPNVRRRPDHAVRCAGVKLFLCIISAMTIIQRQKVVTYRRSPSSCS
jgi:hypothetical protein